MTRLRELLRKYTEFVSYVIENLKKTVEKFDYDYLINYGWEMLCKNKLVQDCGKK